MNSASRVGVKTSLPDGVVRGGALQHVHKEHVGAAAGAGGLDGPGRCGAGTGHAVVVGGGAQEGVAASRLGCRRGVPEEQVC